jgi:hypothetical protein
MFFAHGASPSLLVGRERLEKWGLIQNALHPPSPPRSARGREGKFALRGSVNLSLDLIA